MDEEEPFTELVERIARLEESMRWVKKALVKLDNRTWMILGTVIVGILVSILVRMI